MLFIMSDQAAESCMANSVINIVDDKISEYPPVENVESIEVVENNWVSDGDNSNAARSSMSLNLLLQWEAANGGKAFNIFIQSNDSKAFPQRDPRAVQAEIKKNITKGRRY